jgi:hypothetical protein
MNTKIFRYLLLLMVAISMFNCSEQPVAPVEPTEDFATHAEAYSPNEFVLEITTVTYDPSYPPHPVELRISGTVSAMIVIDWGDSTIEDITLEDYYSNPYYEHQYSRVKNYTIKITGKIKNIDYFGMEYQDVVKVNNIYLSGLTGLKELSLTIVNGPPVINLSHNKLLETLTLVALPLRDITMPSTNVLRHVDISSTPEISTAAVDRVIGRVYESVVSNPREGYFILDKDYWWESDEGYKDKNAMVGPPSSYSITKLKRLRDIYGWDISPDVNP